VGISAVTAVPIAAQASAPRVKVSSRLSAVPAVTCAWNRAMPPATAMATLARAISAVAVTFPAKKHQAGSGVARHRRSTPSWRLVTSPIAWLT
jgi:hypothetical protein